MTLTNSIGAKNSYISSIICITCLHEKLLCLLNNTAFNYSRFTLKKMQQTAISEAKKYISINKF